MGVAKPKSQAKEPIQIDVLLVCQKQEVDTRKKLDSSDVYDAALDAEGEPDELLSLRLAVNPSYRPATDADEDYAFFPVASSLVPNRMVI